MKQNKINILNPKLTIGWLYPDLMSTYGDRGNIIVLRKIAENHNINVEILRLDQNSDLKTIESCNLLFMGGAQDRQQEIVNDDLINKKGKTIINMIEKGIPGLYICGAYQFLGNYYKDSYGTTIKGLGIFDMYTESRPRMNRLIGSIAVSPLNSNYFNEQCLVGFENHGGRTFLQDKNMAFAKVVKGFGNNGEDMTEGIFYKNSIGTYMHGPILPSNPTIAVKLLEMAIEKKYDKKVELSFNDEISLKAKNIILSRLEIK